MKKMIKVPVFLLAIISQAVIMYAAVPCALTNPDRDIRRLFPDSTNYRTIYKNIHREGGQTLKQEIEEKLGDKLDDYSEYEIDHIIYKVVKGSNTIGYVFGNNQRGRYGNLQIFLSTTPDGQIKEMYYQIITAPYSNDFRALSFTAKFRGLSLRDFYLNDNQIKNYNPQGNRVAQISSPNSAANLDLKNTLRAVKKLLIHFDIFILNRAYNRFYKKN
jgi:hypothetical protein